jgi:endonuclease YncB( thermonuclease family)
LISIVSPLDAVSDKTGAVDREHTGTGRIVSSIMASTASRGVASIALLFAHGLVLLSTGGVALAGGCLFDPQGEGRVAAVIDAGSVRLEDGREVRLAGIEPADRSKGAAALSAILAGRDVNLRGADDTPDRYGRQSAFVYLAGATTPVQDALLRQGDALVSAHITDRDCAAALAAAEAEARQAKRGAWGDPSVIKNAERSGDILAGIGRFAVVEGRVLSVREAGATTYLNFGRNWTRDFAATISRRMMPAFEAAGLQPKSLENRRIRIRGVIEARGGSSGGSREGPKEGPGKGPTEGPRIEVLRVGQIEVLGGN